jgi:hypothetical protein
LVDALVDYDWLPDNLANDRLDLDLVEDGCSWIENRLDSRSTRAACAAMKSVVGGDQ